MADFQAIVGKILADPGFGEQLVKDPAGVMRANGVEPTAEMIDAVKALDAAAVRKLAAAFGKQQAA